MCLFMYVYECMCDCLCVSVTPNLTFSPVTAWVLNYSCVYVCVPPTCVCVQLCVYVCVEEAVCFCGCSNQPPAPSLNTCSPINIQRAGAHSLLLPSHCFLPFFFPLFSFFSQSQPLAPFVPASACISASAHPAPSSCLLLPHMLLLCTHYFTPYCLVHLLLFFFLYITISSTHHPHLPFL